MTTAKLIASNNKDIANLKEEVLKMLAQNAVDVTFYVASGKCLVRDMAEKHKLGLDQVQGIISTIAVKIVDHIRELS